MPTIEDYRRALERIAGYDASKANGYLDEWQEAEAFEEVKRIAQEALDPEDRTRRVAAKQARLEANRQAIRSLRRNERYFYTDHAGTKSGAWVRFLKGDPDRAYDGIVRVKVLERVGNPFSETLRPGAEISMHVANLRPATAAENTDAQA